MNKINYRIDIDGLRALAVMAVILSHLDIQVFKGGFIGVDIFFVISGFLITALLHKEYSENGSINLGRFFWRRMQRLYPATIVTALLTTACGFFLFSNERFASVVWSSVSSIFSYSNVYFWSHVGYFDADAATKPLLHTWSLGVEEQFYLFWSITVLLLLKLGSKKGLIIGIAILSLLSFAANSLFLDGELGAKIAPETGLFSGLANGTSSAFYLFPFRVFEFGMGGLLSLNIWRARHVKFATETAVVTGLSIIMGYTFFLGSENVFPYSNALIVSGGSLLLLWGGATSKISKLLFANALTVFIGRISYSLYLVHWPITVYWKYLAGGSLEVIDVILMLPIMIGAGYVLHISIENKFRHTSYWSGKAQDIKGVFTRALLPLSLVATSFLIVGSLKVDRIPDSRKTITNAEWRDLEWNTYCIGDIPGYSKTLISCQNNRGSRKTILVWGDSHARHLIAGFSELFPDTNIAMAYVSACPPQSGLFNTILPHENPDLQMACSTRNQNLFKALVEKQIKPDVVFLTSNRLLGKLHLIDADDPNTKTSVPDVTEKILSNLQQNGVLAYYLADFIKPGKELASCRATPSYVLNDTYLARLCQPSKAAVLNSLEFAENMKIYITKYIPVHEVQCPNNICTFNTRNGWITHRDEHHLSLPGSIEMMKLSYPMLVKYIPELADFKADLTPMEFSLPGPSTYLKANLLCPASQGGSPAFEWELSFTKNEIGAWIYSTRTEGKVVSMANYDHYELNFLGDDSAVLTGNYVRGGLLKSISMIGDIRRQTLLMSGKRGPRDCNFTITNISRSFSD